MIPYVIHKVTSLCSSMKRREDNFPLPPSSRLVLSHIDRHDIAHSEKRNHLWVYSVTSVKIILSYSGEWTTINSHSLTIWLVSQVNLLPFLRSQVQLRRVKRRCTKRERRRGKKERDGEVKFKQYECNYIRRLLILVLITRERMDWFYVNTTVTF